MIRDDYRCSSGAQFLRAMFANTCDGKLTIGNDESDLATIPMDWDAGTAEELAQRCETLLEQLTRLGEEHERWAASTEGMPAQLLPVWDTYVRPFPDHGMDQATLEEIWQKESVNMELSDSELQLFHQYNRWYGTCAMERLPYNRCSPVDLINRARRYEKLVSLKAPRVVVENEGRCLAEEMALYHCMKANTHICRCCGNGYDLEDYGGYVGYSICPVCKWEEDDCYENEYSDTNGDTLCDYRRKFRSK